jgi:lysophospholipase L1-like esterase
MAAARTPRRTAVGLAAGALSLGLTLAVLEAGLRLSTYGSLWAPTHAYHLQLFDPHPTRGWTLKPALDEWLRTPDFTVHFQTSSKGFRDVEHTHEKPPGAFRVVVLGDSFMEAGQVDLEQAFVKQLERRLDAPGAEVINLGVSGYGTLQELLMLQEEGLRYDPDVVVVAFFPDNDLRNNHPELEKRLGFLPDRPFARFDAAGALEVFRRDSKVEYMNLASQQRRLKNKQKAQTWWKRTVLYDKWEKAARAGSAADPSIPKYDPNIWLGVYAERFDPALGPGDATADELGRYWEESFDLLGPLLAEMQRTAEAGSARLLVFTVPARPQVDTEYAALLDRRYPTLALDPPAVNARLVALAAEHGVELLDLLPAFQAAAADGAVLHNVIADDHWNAAGHALAAERVAEALAD